jgi:hypothetical protein
MNSEELARYIEATNSISKPWLLTQLRLKKLQERKGTLSPEAYDRELADIHKDLMNLGEWWVGIEDEEFGQPNTLA